MSDDKRKLSMKLTFYGAVENDVTGSISVLEIKMSNLIKRIAIDCGMFQGADGIEYSHAESRLLDPRSIDAILLTHAHLDHSGEIPLFYKLGYTGEVYGSREALVQAQTIMYDCARINKNKLPRSVLDSLYAAQKRSAKSSEKQTKKQRMENLHDAIETELDDVESDAIYLEDDVDEAIKHFHPVKPLKNFCLFNGIMIRFVPNTHQNGACSIEIVAYHGGEKLGIAFSGDIGPSTSYLYKSMKCDPNPDINYCVLESLHGVNPPEETFFESLKKLRKLVKRSIYEKKSLYIGVFALDRSALMLALMNKLKAEGLVFDLWFDSPLGEIQLQNYINSYMNGDSFWFKHFDSNPFNVNGAKFSSYYRQHMELVADTDPKVVIVTSCMGHGGRIVDYFENHIQDRNAIFAFAGYLPPECPSSVLHEAKAHSIFEFGKAHFVKHCETVRFHGFTSHGYYPEMFEFVNQYPNLKAVFLNHAEETSKEDVKAQLQEDIDAEIIIPQYDEWYEL